MAQARGALRIVVALGTIATLVDTSSLARSVVPSSAGANWIVDKMGNISDNVYLTEAGLGPGEPCMTGCASDSLSLILAELDKTVHRLRGLYAHSGPTSETTAYGFAAELQHTSAGLAANDSLPDWSGGVDVDTEDLQFGAEPDHFVRCACSFLSSPIPSKSFSLLKYFLFSPCRCLPLGLCHSSPL